MSGGSEKQTTQENKKTDPWAPAIPGLQNLVGKTTDLLDSGTGSGVYDGPRVAGLGSDTLAGLDQLKSGAAAGAPVAQSGNGFVNGLLAGGGATAATTGATANLAGINPNVDTSGVAGAAGALSDPNNIARTTGASLAGGAFGTDTSALNGLAGGLATDGTQTQRSLQDVADGKYLTGGNPFLDDIVARSQNEAASKVAQSFAASGRYGSGRFAGATQDAAQNAGQTLRYNDYSTERDRQAQAASAIDSAGLARAGLAGNLFSTVAGINQGNASTAATGAGLAQGALRDSLTGQQAVASLDGSNVDRQMTQANALLSGAQSDRAAGLAGIAALPTVQNALLQPGKTLAGVGAVQDQARQDQLDADKALFDDRQTAPWKPLGLAASILQPIAGLGGTTESNSVSEKKTDPGLLNSIVGTISTLTGTAANLGKSNAFGPAGWIAALSDRRAKEDIRAVGTLYDGQIVYAYRYKGDPQTQIGLMAQDVAERVPDAVGPYPGAPEFLGVDYAKATAQAAAIGRHTALAA